jgi:uncharacterized protein YggT (Ycf19 family)
MAYYGQDIILIGIIIGAFFIILLITMISKWFFPKSKVSKILDRIIDFFRYDLHFS